MEYQLLKTIEPNLGLCRNPPFPQLSPYPAFDYVNPGVGQISRLFSFYVPIHTRPNLHSLEKKVSLNETVPLNEADNREGFGAGEEEVSEESKEIKRQLESDPLEFNESKKQRMGAPIHNAFLSPKVIKTNKIVLVQKTQSPKNEKIQETKSAKIEPRVVDKKLPQIVKSKANHKFQFFK